MQYCTLFSELLADHFGDFCCALKHVRWQEIVVPAARAVSLRVEPFANLSHYMSAYVRRQEGVKLLDK